MRLREIRQLVQLRRPAADSVTRTLQRCVTVEDLRRTAHARWPPGVRGYVEGGADGEVSVDRNVAAFRNFDITPSVLRDVSAVDLSTDLIGARAAMPIALAPTGYTRMMHPDGERGAALAALKAGVPYSLSTMATTSLEDVSDVGGDLWFQLYIWRDRRLSASLVERAAAAGYRVLMVCVDSPVIGLRVRDVHNGFTLPPRLTPKALVGMAAHPAWCAAMLKGPPITFANFEPAVSAESASVMEFAARQFDPSVSWDDLDWVRRQWKGPLVVKGVVRPDDVARAAAAGADAVIMSNHGGRQLDQSIPPIEALPDARARAGSDIQILIDSGVRRGADIAVALASGADGCLVGRPYLYGLGAAGSRGATAALTMLSTELARTMSLMGVRDIATLKAEGPNLVQRRGDRSR